MKLVLIFDLRLANDRPLVVTELNEKVLAAFPTMNCLGEGAFLIPDAVNFDDTVQRLRTATLTLKYFLHYCLAEVSDIREGNLSATGLSNPTPLS